MKKLTPNQASSRLNISVDNLNTLEQNGILKIGSTEKKDRLYSASEIDRITSRRGMTLSQEAAQMGIDLQRQMTVSLTTTRKILLLLLGGWLGYAAIILLLTGFFINNPLQTARWLGYNQKTSSDRRQNQEKFSFIQSLLQPASYASLYLVKSINPQAYTEIASTTIINPNDIFTVYADGSISPQRAMQFLDNEALQVINSSLITNLNAEFLQGKKIGTQPGDIAVIGNNGRIEGLSDPVGAPPVLEVIASGLTNANLSGNAGITNNNLANSNIKIVGENGITVSQESVALGGSITLRGPTLSDSLATTITDLKGVPLGDTTATTGNILIGNGVEWVAQALGGDATIASNGTLLLKNTGTAATYGNSSSIPVITTDAQGRVTGVINTTLANLTNANLSGSAGITNANLANSNITITAGSNLTGGGITALGGSTTLNVSSTPIFTTVNGLTLSNNGANTLSIAAGKTFTADNSLTFTGTDGTTFIFPASSDSIAGIATLQTLTNKTIAAGSNFITGITNSNLSGTAAISNANLANSTFSLLGNSGSGLAALGGGITLAGAGITNVTSSGSTFTLTSTEVDTFQSIYNRGNTITTTTGRDIAFTLDSGLATPTSMTLTNSGTAHSLIITDASNSNLDSQNRRSMLINPGSITQNTGGTSGSYSGVDIALPTLTLTSGTALTANGVKITTNNVTQSTGSLTQNGLVVDSSSSIITSGGTINGVKIEAPTTLPSVGNYNNLALGTSTSSVAHSYDVATIAVGNIASTAQQNFSTLEIKNGGSGYLDIELVRGFINFQNMNTLTDDFTDRAINTTNRWTTTASGGGSTCSILAGSLNGLLRMVAGAGGTNRACELTTQAITTLTNGYYQRGNNPIMETKISLSSLTNDIVYAGFTDTRVTLGSNTNPNTNHAYFAKRSTDTNWQCVTDDGGAIETYTDTGVTVQVGTTYRLRVELRSGATPETICTIDTGTATTRTVVTATQPNATSPMDIYLSVMVTANTTAKNMDVDYVRAWQDDPPLFALDKQGNLLAAQEEASTPPITEEIIPESEDLHSLIASSVHDLFANLQEFFGNVIFHNDVAFLGRPTFNKDTAGHAFIGAGENEVRITFEKSYKREPSITASLNLVGSINPDDLPRYAIFNSNTEGFSIKLARAAASDLHFSWIALAVSSENSNQERKSAPASEAPIGESPLQPPESPQPPEEKNEESTASAVIQEPIIVVEESIGSESAQITTP